MSGVLHGLFRVRYFTQDDAHIYCTPEQLEEEVLGVVRFMKHIYAAFGFTDVKIELSTRPDKSIGSDEVWELAEGVLGRVLEGEGIEYVLNPGDGAFYGPKIDFHIRDVMGRTWQCGTIQVDFAMPERLDITYTGADNEEHRPVMIHRALLGSIERFMGILLEHYGGNLPTWLAPEQVLVLPIADRHADYAARSCAPCARPARGAGRTPRSRSMPTSTTAARASASASATRNCRRCPTSSWSATARWTRAPSACASAARTRARGRSASSSTSWSPRCASGGCPSGPPDLRRRRGRESTLRRGGTRVRP